MKMTPRDWILDTLAVAFWIVYGYFTLHSLGELLVLCVRAIQR